MTSSALTTDDLYEGSCELKIGPTRVCVSRALGSGDRRFLLLHGNPSSMGMDFQNLVRPLLRLGSVAAFDLPGLGRSSCPAHPGEVDIDALSALVPAVLSHLGWEHATLVGHSHGGGVAQRTAVCSPRRVSALVLIGTLGITAHGYYKALALPGARYLLQTAQRLTRCLSRERLAGLVYRFMMDGYYPSTPARAEVATVVQALRTRPTLLRNMAWLARGDPCEKLRDGARCVRVPTLILHGRDDRTVPIEFGRAVAEAISASRFVEMTGGHGLPSRAPDDVVSEIEAFQRKGPPGKQSWPTMRCT